MLRIYLGEDDHAAGKRSYEAVVEAARRAGLAGATVLRGSLGYGAESVMHKPRLWHLSGDLPIVIEIVDSAAAIETFLPALAELLKGGGLITREKVLIVRYSESAEAP
ncbi:MAG TPA: DUF190 domain-containing protein [Trueperaceae bacterium]